MSSSAQRELCAGRGLNVHPVSPPFHHHPHFTNMTFYRKVIVKKEPEPEMTHWPGLLLLLTASWLTMASVFQVSPPYPWTHVYEHHPALGTALGTQLMEDLLPSSKDTWGPRQGWRRQNLKANPAFWPLVFLVCGLWAGWDFSLHPALPLSASASSKGFPICKMGLMERSTCKIIMRIK